jgi:hypothetical protein
MWRAAASVEGNAHFMRYHKVTKEKGSENLQNRDNSKRSTTARRMAAQSAAASGSRRCESRKTKRGESFDEANPEGSLRSPATHANGVRMRKKLEERAKSPRISRFYADLATRFGC